MFVRKVLPYSPRTRGFVNAAALVAVLLVVAMVVPLSRWVPTGRVQLRPLQRSESSCTMALTTTLDYTICEPVDVTTVFTPACSVCPDGLNVVFIQDDTPYPDWQKRVSLQALGALQQYAMDGHTVAVGVIHYNGQGVRTALRPTTYLNAARGPLTSFRVAHDPRALFMEAAQAGVAMIRQGRQVLGGATNPECEFVIFFVYTKVYMADKGEEMIQAGRTILRAVPNLYVGCPHQHPEECTVWEPQVPKSQFYYTEDPEPSKLLGMVNRGLKDIDTKGIVRLISMTTDQVIPPGLEVMPDSYNIEPHEVRPEGGQVHLMWDWRLPKVGEPVTLTFRAEGKTPGEWESEVTNEWRDSANRMGKRNVESDPITVIDDPCITPTPTVPPPPTPTDTPSPTPTDTPVPTATETPTRTPVPTATARPKPIYLPLALSEVCVPGEVHADVVLVLDISTSMKRLTRSGRTKLAATQDAAKQFVSLMDLTADASGKHDQVAIVGFNMDAWIEAPLGPGAARVNAAIDALAGRMAEKTRLDLGFKVGAEAILTGPRRTDNTPVLILLTDGLPNMVPYAEDGTVETTVLRAAAAAKDAGIRVFTIAIGAPEDTNPTLLTACASAPDHYYYTPDPDDLATIYRGIAHQIDCPRSMFWGQR